MPLTKAQDTEVWARPAWLSLGLGAAAAGCCPGAGPCWNCRQGRGLRNACLLGETGRKTLPQLKPCHWDCPGRVLEEHSAWMDRACALLSTSWAGLEAPSASAAAFLCSARAAVVARNICKRQLVLATQSSRFSLGKTFLNSFALLWKRHPKQFLLQTVPVSDYFSVEDDMRGHGVACTGGGHALSPK